MPDAPAETTPPRPGLRDALHAFHYRNFTLFWVGALLSNTGTWVQNVTVPYVVYQITGSAAVVGTVAFAQLIPMVVFGPLGGAIADRYPRRTVLIVTQSALAVEALLLWGLWVTGHQTLWVLLPLVVAGGVVTGLNIPSWQAFVSELVPRQALLNAVTLNSTQFNAARAFGPMVGGLVLQHLGESPAFLINAVSFLCVIGALLLIRLPAGVDRAHDTGARGHVLRDFAAAARATRAYPGIRACFVAVVALGALGAPLSSLLVVFAQEVFGVDKAAYGLLATALGLGSVLAAPFIAGPGSGMPRRKLLGLAMVGYGSAIAAFGLAPGFAVGFVVLLVSSAGYLAIASTLNTTIQLQVAERIRGKVLALYVMLLTAAMPLGSLVQGWCIDWFGARQTVFVAGVAFLAVTAWLWWGSGLVAHLDDNGPVGGHVGGSYLAEPGELGGGVADATVAPELADLPEVVGSADRSGTPDPGTERDPQSS